MDNELEAIHNMVGGYIQPARLYNNMIILFDEDGLWKELKDSAVIVSDAGYLGLVGNVVLVRDCGEDFADLTDEDIETVFSWSGANTTEVLEIQNYR